MHLMDKDFELASHRDAKITWKGSLQPRPNKHGERYTLKGWKLYAEAQKLAAGDQVAFELVNKNRLVITVVYKAIAEPLWTTSGEGSHTNAESQAEAAAGNSSPPDNISAWQNYPTFSLEANLPRCSEQRQHKLMEGLRSIRSRMQAQEGSPAVATSMAASPSFRDIPFGLPPLPSLAAPPRLGRPAILDHSLEHAARRMLAEACQGQLPQDQMLGQWVPEGTRSCQAAADSCTEGQRYELRDFSPAAKAADICSALPDDNQPACKRQKLLAEELTAQTCCMKPEAQQALDTERYVHVLESILGRRSSSTNLLPEPTAHRSNSEGSPTAQIKAHGMSQPAMSKFFEADQASHDLPPAPPGSPAALPVSTAIGENGAGRQEFGGEQLCNLPAAVGSQAEQSGILLDTLAEHSRQAVNAVLGLQLRLGPQLSSQVQGYLTRLLEILRSQLMTLADCDDAGK